MIDKVFPRKLNSSKDTRLHAQDEMLDAVNVTIDDNSGEFVVEGNSTPTGNFGVLKPLKGNTAVPKGDSHSLAAGSKVIGSCNDERAGRIYYFVYSPTAAQSGVYFYDPSSNNVKKLLTSDLFNFRGNSYVDGNVVYVANSDTSVGATDLKPILFFTDNHSEPKKIDIQRVGEAGSGVQFLDFVSACPRTPVDPPSWSFQSDPSYKVSNFRGERGFQFAYQNIYKSGDVSAVSTYSTLAVPSAYLNQGTVSNPNFFAENYIAVVIPSGAFTSEVARVRVLARSGNTGSWLVIDEQNYAGGQLQTNFYNDEIYTVLPEAEAKKQFDSLPKKARTQEVTNNRLFYANYVEGFDVPDVNATISHTFLERPQDFIAVNLVLTPEIRPLNNELVEEVQNRCVAYRLDSAQLPQTVTANTQVIFNISLTPENNFHFYEARDSFHGSAEQKRFLSPPEQFHICTTDNHIMKSADMAGGETLGIAPSGLGYFNGQDPNGFDVPTGDGGTAGVKRHGITSIPYGVFQDDDGAFPRWSTLRPQDPEALRVSYGTSAQNPFILKGDTCQFEGSFVTKFDMDKARIVNIIKDMLVDNHTSSDSSVFNTLDVDGQVVTESVVDILSLTNRHTYNFDLQIENKDKIGVYQSDDYRSDLVIAVGANDDIIGTDTRQIPPCGYFIVNKAKPTVGLRDITPFFAKAEYNQANDSFLALDLITISDFETMTCVPDVCMGENVGQNLLQLNPDAQDGQPSVFSTIGTDYWSWGNIFDGWVCMTANFISSPTGLGAMSASAIGAVDEVPDSSKLFKHNGKEIYAILQDGVFDYETNENQSDTPHLLGTTVYTGTEVNLYRKRAFDVTGQDDGDLLSRNMPQHSRWLGYLIPAGGYVQSGFGVGIFGGVINVIGGRLITTFENHADDVMLNEGIDIKKDPAAYYQYAFTMIDGEGGAGSQTTYVKANKQNDSSITHGMIIMGFGSWLNNAYVNGAGFGTGLGKIRFEEFNHNMGTMRAGTEFIDTQRWHDIHPVGDDFFLDLESVLPEDHFVFGEKRSIVEVTAFDAAVVPAVEGGGSNRSFKTKATHDFGIVFYDQRGRSSDVVPLGSVYVEGYDSATEQGPVNVQVALSSAPPSWAWHYQIVYGGNNTYSDFVQYTTGGAFLEKDPDDNTGNIYVSLNYLQGNSDVSYAESFGAVNEDGSKDLYTYKEGDKLRVLSYYTDNENRVFPSSYEFDIIGTRDFGAGVDNILADPQFPPAIPSKVGQFLVLRDNPEATGFSYTYVKAGQVDGNSPSSSASHLWNNRCVVEIYRPKDIQGVEDRVYYEISKKYNVIRENGSLTWENNNIVLNNGDVWFRRVAVNMPLFDQNVNKFRNLLKDAGNASPRFRDYYLETTTFTDTISGANQYDYGKPKIVNRFQKEIRRDSSVTFSDFTSLSNPVLKYTSFDGSVGNFKDLPNKHGQISKIVDYGDALFVLNEDKISAIPIARSVISDLSGQDFVIASQKVMGTQKFYAGDSGCSTNPESVVKVGESLYFANKERQEVYKFNPANGVTVISDMGMKSYFRELFQSALDEAIQSGQVRVVGGYDPILDEYVLSVYNAVSLVFGGDVEVTQPTGTATPDDPIPVGDSDDPPVAIDDALVEELQEEIDVLEEANDQIQDQLDSLYENVVDVVGGDGGVSVQDLNTQLSDFVDGLNTEIDGLDDVIIGLESDIEVLVDAGGDDAATIQQLNNTIGVLEDALNTNDGVITAGLVATSNAHASLKANLEQAIEIMGQVRADIFELFDPDQTLTVPPVADEFPEIAQAGTGVTALVYADLLQAYINLAQEKVDLHDDTDGAYVMRNGTTFTDYTIGYGVPTTESLSDADLSSDLPVGSALYTNPEFVNEASALVAEMNASSAATGSVSANQLSTTLGLTETALEGVEGDLAAEQATTAFVQGQLEAEQGISADLFADKQALLQNIADIVGAIYNTRGPNQGQNGFDGAVSLLFGDEYAGTTSNLITTLHQAGQSGLVNLETALSQFGPSLTTTISANLEQGILAYKDDQFESVIDSKVDEITSLTATRDTLLVQAFNTVNAIWHLSGKPANVLPASFNSLLDGLTLSSTPTITEIQSAFDTSGDGTLDPADLIAAADIVSDFEPTLEALYATEEAIDALRGPITNFLVQTSNTINKFDFNTSDDETSDILEGWVDKLDSGTDQDVIDVLEAFNQILNQTPNNGGVSIADGIVNLQEAIVETAVRWNEAEGLTSENNVFGFHDDGVDRVTQGTLYPFDIDDGDEFTGKGALRPIYESIYRAVERVVQFQRFLGNVGDNPETPSAGGVYSQPIEHEGLSQDDLFVKDFFEANGTIIDNTGSGWKGTGRSLLTGLHRALSNLEADLHATTDLFDAFGAGPTDNPSSGSWNFTDFQVTNTLQDFVGVDLYEPAVADIEAAFAVANNLSGELNSTLGNTFTAGEVT